MNFSFFSNKRWLELLWSVLFFVFFSLANKKGWSNPVGAQWLYFGVFFLFFLGMGAGLSYLSKIGALEQINSVLQQARSGIFFAFYFLVMAMIFKRCFISIGLFVLIMELGIYLGQRLVGSTPNT